MREVFAVKKHKTVKIRESEEKCTFSIHIIFHMGFVEFFSFVFIYIFACEKSKASKIGITDFLQHFLRVYKSFISDYEFYWFFLYVLRVCCFFASLKNVNFEKKTKEIVKWRKRKKKQFKAFQLTWERQFYQKYEDDNKKISFWKIDMKFFYCLSFVSFRLSRFTYIFFININVMRYKCEQLL